MATRSLSFLKTAENMSMSLSAEGKDVTGYGANIFKKDVRDTLLNLFEDLAKYEIDGIPGILCFKIYTTFTCYRHIQMASVFAVMKYSKKNSINAF